MVTHPSDVGPGNIWFRSQQFRIDVFDGLADLYETDPDRVKDHAVIKTTTNKMCGDGCGGGNYVFESIPVPSHNGIASAIIWFASAGLMLPAGTTSTLRPRIFANSRSNATNAHGPPRHESWRASRDGTDPLPGRREAASCQTPDAMAPERSSAAQRILSSHACGRAPSHSHAVAAERLSITSSS